MGDRTNYGIVQHNTKLVDCTSCGHKELQNVETGILYAYLHSGPGAGSILSEFASAIDAARSRWDDEAYATAIVLRHLEPSGITLDYLSDNSHRVPVVDFVSGVVSLTPSETPGTNPIFTLPLDRFVSKYL